MPKFFVDNNNIRDKKIYVESDYNHIKNVLRKKVGDKIKICNKETYENFICKINNYTEKEIECDIIEKINDETEPNIKITIYQGLPKAEKMEMIIQKGIELGVYEFVPIKMKNCVVKINEKENEKKIQRWQKISEVASKQCGRNIIPKVHNIITIKDICNKIKDFDCVIVAYENETENTLKNEIEYLKNNKFNKIAILIGPEGGFDKEEIKMLKQNGAKIITLGKRILRTETVVMFITSILMYELGDIN